MRSTSLRLALAQQAVVDEDAVQLVADRAVHERGRHRRVDAAREPADDLRVPDLRADPRTASSMKASMVHESRAAADAVHEVREQLAAAFGVHHLGVELEAVERPLAVAHGGERASSRSTRCASKPAAGAARGRRGSSRRCARRGPQAGEERVAAALELQQGAAVLAVVRRLDDAAELLAQQLEAVADAEHRHAELEHSAVASGASASSTLDGPPESTMPCGAKRAHGVQRQTARMDLAVDAALADPARDQLGVLGAEVEDQDPVAMRVAEA